MKPHSTREIEMTFKLIVKVPEVGNAVDRNPLGVILLSGNNFFVNLSNLEQEKSPWRNRLARSAVNRKVGGSSPPGDDFFSIQRCANKCCSLKMGL